MAVYPGAIPTIPGGGTWTHDQVGDEIEAIAGTLGVNPHGSKATVAARLQALANMVVPGPVSTFHLRNQTVMGDQGIPDLELQVTPMSVGRQFTVDQADFWVKTGVVGTTYRVAIYGTNDDGLPGNLLVQSADIDTGTAAGLSAALTPTLIPSGLIWVGGYANRGGGTSSATFRVTSNTAPAANGFFAGVPSGSTAYHSGYACKLNTDGTLPAVFPTTKAPGSTPSSGATDFVSTRFIPIIWLRAQ